jgi:hypothetical protein
VAAFILVRCFNCCSAMAGCRLWGMAQQERRSAGSDAAGLAEWLEQALLHAGVITTCHLLAGAPLVSIEPSP